MLSGRNLSLLRDHHVLVDAIDIDVRPGEVLSILGPNGAGKTSLLGLLSGEIEASLGSVTIEGQALRDMSPSTLARARAVLPQSESLRFSFTVRQVLELGRHPWLGLGSRDKAVIDELLALTGLDALADRLYPKLSGGERARVQFARVLAQLWPLDRRHNRYLLLDEPTASLDLSVQTELLGWLRRLADQGLAVVVILHDLNQALQVSDRVLLMKAGKKVAYDAAKDVLQPEPIRDAFGVEVEYLSAGEGRPPWIVPVTRSRFADLRETSR